MLADAAREGALGIVCLGDLVGYGADPIACVETLGERAVATVAGNHEHGALGLLDLDWFNPVARAATSGRATPSTRTTGPTSRRCRSAR